MVERDNEKMRLMRQAGFKVIRFSNEDVLNDASKVKERLRSYF